jgi:hypothetical protein
MINTRANARKSQTSFSAGAIGHLRKPATTQIVVINLSGS